MTDVLYVKNISYTMSHIFFLVFVYLFTIPRYSKKRTLVIQCHLDKDDAKNSVCRNMYPVLFLYNFINHLTG